MWAGDGLDLAFFSRRWTLCILWKLVSNNGCVAFIQELVIDAVCELKGSVVENDKMCGLLSETHANIDGHHSMLRELCYLQVSVTIMSHSAMILCDV